MKATDRFYSQNGQDFLLSEIFMGKEDGFFVDVGCIDGRRFSNTLAFEEKGWKGLCIEAHAGYIDLLRVNRPGSTVVHCAVSDEDKDNVTFYANSRGSLSTLDPSQQARWERDFPEYFTGFEEQIVKTRRLDSIFREYGVKDIDFMSLDIEGHEAAALRGLDLREYRPTVLVIEAPEADRERELDLILGPVGYYRLARLSFDVFYGTSRGLEAKIKGLFERVELTRSEHPLDSDGEKTVVVDIDTRESADPMSGRSGIIDRIRSRLASATNRGTEHGKPGSC